MPRRTGNGPGQGPGWGGPAKGPGNGGKRSYVSGGGPAIAMNGDPVEQAYRQEQRRLKQERRKKAWEALDALVADKKAFGHARGIEIALNRLEGAPVPGGAVIADYLEDIPADVIAALDPAKLQLLIMQRAAREGHMHVALAVAKDVAPYFNARVSPAEPDDKDGGTTIKIIGGLPED